MDSIFEKEEFNYEDIQQLIANEAEESIHLEFKAADSLSKSDGKKKEISKDVAAFANSDGGVIIYGIKEKNHKATEITFIDGNEYTKEWLEQVIQSNIQRHIPDLRIFPIRNDLKISESIYIIKIPYSYDAPHMSNDGRFYKRYNYQAVPMEEYEVRQSYDRKKATRLEIFGCFYGENTNYQFVSDGCKGLVIQVLVKNIGLVIEKHFKAEIAFQNLPLGIIINTPRELNSNIISSESFSKVTISNTAPIFPGETVSAAIVNIDIPYKDYLELLEQINFNVCLMYTSDYEIKDYNLKNIIEDALHITSKSTRTP